jgi:hypothetical protein
MLHNLHFFPSQNAVYFIMLSFLGHEIFTFYQKGALKFQFSNSLLKVVVAHVPRVVSMNILSTVLR